MIDFLNNLLGGNKGRDGAEYANEVSKRFEATVDKIAEKAPEIAEVIREQPQLIGQLDPEFLEKVAGFGPKDTETLEQLRADYKDRASGKLNLTEQLNRREMLEGIDAKQAKTRKDFLADLMRRGQGDSVAGASFAQAIQGQQSGSNQASKRAMDMMRQEEARKERGQLALQNLAQNNKASQMQRENLVQARNRQQAQLNRQQDQYNLDRQQKHEYLTNQIAYDNAQAGNRAKLQNWAVQKDLADMYGRAANARIGTETAYSTPSSLEQTMGFLGDAAKIGSAFVKPKTAEDGGVIHAEDGVIIPSKEDMSDEDFMSMLETPAFAGGGIYSKDGVIDDIKPGSLAGLFGKKEEKPKETEVQKALAPEQRISPTGGITGPIVTTDSMEAERQEVPLTDRRVSLEQAALNAGISKEQLDKAREKAVAQGLSYEDEIQTMAEGGIARQEALMNLLESLQEEDEALDDDLMDEINHQARNRHQDPGMQPAMPPMPPQDPMMAQGGGAPMPPQQPPMPLQGAAPMPPQGAPMPPQGQPAPAMEDGGAFNPEIFLKNQEASKRYQNGGTYRMQDGDLTFISDGSGDVVKGDSFERDRVDARLNSGEAVLNVAQQQRLMDLLRGKISLDELGDDDIVEGVPADYQDDLTDMLDMGMSPSDDDDGDMDAEMRGLKKLIKMLGSDS